MVYSLSKGPISSRSALLPDRASGQVRRTIESCMLADSVRRGFIRSCQTDSCSQSGAQHLATLAQVPHAVKPIPCPPPAAASVIRRATSRLPSRRHRMTWGGFVAGIWSDNLRGLAQLRRKNDETTKRNGTIHRAWVSCPDLALCPPGFASLCRSSQPRSRCHRHPLSDTALQNPGPFKAWDWQ